ncbi:aminoglycoside phosphotransferase family protein [Castellaniella sp.]|uniref:aminoglycoside phosphotransferase family protein n=1 Tax=Castellaniella sp. TaxID=1955812 RepID=UPI003A938221
MTHTTSADPRLAALQHWLDTLATSFGLHPDTLTPVSGDASFRRYFRVQSDTGPRIVMDAPPPQEDCTPFIDIAQRLTRGGLQVPEIFAQEISLGFLLISDLGSQTFYEAIQNGATQDDTTWQQHMRGALRALVKMQGCPANGIPAYDAARLMQELQLFPQWYLQVHHQHTPNDATLNALAQIFELLAQQAADQPQVFVHRDYHSPNLMLGAGAPDYIPGIIDFQDAVCGPISYDIASLVMDARTTWDEPTQLDWAIRYWEYARDAKLPVPADFAQFHMHYEWMSLQRNLRILGIFARLSHRDGKHHYLDHIPRVLAYVQQVAGRYQLFRPLLRLLDQLDGQPRQDGYSF